MDLWYRDGLSFGCSQCGRCCSGAPGVVWVDREEIRRIAAYLEVPADELWGRILRRVSVSRAALTERPNGDCVFLRRGPHGDRSCAIYTLRPQQCRTWPFWTPNLVSRPAWDELAAGCPGINVGRTYSFDEIEAIRAAAPWHSQVEEDRREVRK